MTRDDFFEHYAVETARQGQFEAIHVTDAEGDFFELLASLQSRSARFVIRAGQLDRMVSSEDDRRSLRQVVNEIVPRMRRTVDLCERKHESGTPRAIRRRHPERAARKAKLAIGSARVLLDKTRYSHFRTEPFELSVVRV